MAGWWWCTEEKGLEALPRASDHPAGVWAMELRWCGLMSLVLGLWVGPEESRDGPGGQSK